MIVCEIREATGRGSECPRYGAVDTHDRLNPEDVYLLAVDGRPNHIGHLFHQYGNCATGFGETSEEAEEMLSDEYDAMLLVLDEDLENN